MRRILFAVIITALAIGPAITQDLPACPFNHRGGLPNATWKAPQQAQAAVIGCSRLDKLRRYS